MWNRTHDNPSKADDDVSSKSSRRKDEEQHSTRHRSGSVNSSSSKKKSSSSRTDNRDRGFEPISTSYSSTSRSPYPNTAGASVASSYATASGNNNVEPYTPPGLVRNASLADKIPKSNSSRGERDLSGEQVRRTERRKERSASRERKKDKKDRPRSRDRGEKMEKSDKRDRKDRERAKDSRVNKSTDGVGDGDETSRGPAEFSNQIGGAGFMQFPGQYDAGIPTSNGGPADQTAAMSSHVQDQFPGQFPLQSSTPYRPPIAASEGGPGLAAEYYGDAGQSVAEQPGYRIHSPSLIVGAEPHLQPASSVAAPPPEPSASGGVGAAASFFSGDFISDEAEPSHGQQNSPPHTSAPNRPHSDHHSASASATPALGDVAMGAAAGYMMANESSSYQQRPENVPSLGEYNETGSSTIHRPHSQPQSSYVSNESRPPRPGKSSSQSSNIPIYAAATAGAAGLAAAAYHNSHYPSQHNSTTQHHPSTPTKHRHRHHGPLGAFVDFFKDPEGVAQFEEYTEFIGVCKYCFAPGSSPRDAPRKHHYRRRRSNERYGSSTRVDKDSRYSSSENEGRRKKDKSWLATGLAGYGLAKVGESLFKQTKDFDDTYSVKSGHNFSDERNKKTRRTFETKSSRRSHSNELRTEIGITSNGKMYEKDPHGGAFGGPTTTTYTSRRHSNSRSRSRSRTSHRKSGFAEAAAGAAIGSSVAASGSLRQSRSPNGGFVKTKHKSRGHSSERRTKSHKKKKDTGLFSFGSASSSSSNLALAYSSSQDKHRSNKGTKYKDRDDRKAEAALVGLGAAAAALASKDGRSGHKTKGIKDLVAVKEAKEKDRRSSRHNTNFKKPSVSLEEEVWESASEGEFSSVDSNLAFGGLARRGSRESFHSDSSGTNKWGWRWGSKKKGKESPSKRLSSGDSSIPGGTGAAFAGATMMSPDQYSGRRVEGPSGLPLQYVYPMATSDPGRFDVGTDPSVTHSPRPVLVSPSDNVPIQHPQPITPVSSALYSSQAPYSQSFVAPSGPPVFAQAPYQSQASVSSERRSIPEAGDSARDFKLRRRDTAPAQFDVDAAPSSKVSRRRASIKDDPSAVRFDFTGEQEEKDRRQNPRKMKDIERDHRAEEDEARTHADRRSSKGQSSRNSDTIKSRDEDPKRSSETSWALPAAAGFAGAAIVASAITEQPKNVESREERRERRRRERKRDEEEENKDNEFRERRRRQRDRDGDESNCRPEGRRKERERDEEDANTGEHQALSDILPERHDTSNRETRPAKWQEEASARRSSSHENYETFFTPLEFLKTSKDQVKVPSANADADIDLGQSPDVITVEPKRYRDLSTSRSYSPADTDGTLSFPWQVPRLRLVEPTPPSTRGSTPVMKPRETNEEDDEASSKETTSSKVTWGDNQTHEYTVITPLEHRDEFIESSLIKSTLEKDVADQSDNENDQWMRNSPNQPKSTKAQEPNEPSASYGDDYEFAATLAAGAENAGFDPSIVLNDPSLRRRDSPPASQGRIMPGGFEDEDGPRLSKKDKKKRDKATRRQSQPKASEERDDDALVQDIISQVENTEPQDPKNEAPEDFGQEWQSSRKSKSRKSKINSKISNFNGDIATSDTARVDQDLESRATYESPTEDAVSVAGSAATSAEIDNGKKTPRKSKRDSSSFDNVGSSVSPPSTIDAGRDTKSKAKKGSLWDRVLGKSTDNPPQGSIPTDGVREAKAEDYDGMGRKGKKSKDRRSSRESEDNSYDAASTSSRVEDKEKKRRSSRDFAAQDSGRITQDLPDKDRESSRSEMPPAGFVSQYLYEDSESEQTQQQASKSFLWMRPEPPRPPDIPAESGEPLISLSKEHSITDASPTHSLPETRRRRPSEVQLSNLPQSPKALLSPTAVPVHFRRPIPSSGSPRSLSQTALSSAPSVASPSRQKPRPRSTEFKSSTEFRPLWLVERHRSQQGPAPEESYPSLPSSHTTSRASSVHGLEEDGTNQIETHEMTGTNGELTWKTLGLLINADSGASQSDLLDSQQTTPTAITFQHPSSAQEPQSPSSSRPSSSRQSIESSSQPLSVNSKDTTTGVVIGGTAAYALSKADRQYEATPRDFSQGEHDLDDMRQDASSSRPHEYEHSFEGEHSTAAQNTKKGEKAKRKASKADQAQATSVFPTSEKVKRSSGSMGPEPLAPEVVRRLQEQDAQDAVDSWSMSAASPKKNNKEQETIIGGELFLEPPKEEEGQGKPLEESESKILRKGMLPDEIRNVVTVAVGDQDSIADFATPSTTVEDREPIESLLKRRESKSKGKKGKKPRKSLKDGEHVEPMSTVSTDYTGHITEPQDSDIPNDQGNDATVTDSAVDHVRSTSSRAHELSPKAVPLPANEDLDLIDTPQNMFLIENEELLMAKTREVRESEPEDPDEFFTKKSRKKGKKGKKGKQSFPNDLTGQPASNEEFATSPAAEIRIAEEQLKVRLDEPPAVVHSDRAGENEDDFAGFSNKNATKDDNKQKSPVFEFEVDERKPLHLGHDIDVDKDDRDVPSFGEIGETESKSTLSKPPDATRYQSQDEGLSASTSASRDVRAIPSANASEDFRDRTSDEKVSSPLMKDRELEKEPASDQSAKRSDEESLERSANTYRVVVGNAPNVDSSHPPTDIVEDARAFEPGTAATNTASEVKDILEAQQHATDSTNPKVEEIFASSAVDASNLDWAAPKKKKKSRKSTKGQGFSIDASKPAETVHRPSSPAQVDTVAMQESADEAADDLLPKKSKKDKKGKQKSLSMLVGDHEQAAEPKAATTEDLQNFDSRSGIVQESSLTAPAPETNVAKAILVEALKPSGVMELVANTGPEEMPHAAELADEDFTARKSNKDKKKAKKAKAFSVEEELPPTPEGETVSSIGSYVARNAMETNSKMLDSMEATESPDTVDETCGVQERTAEHFAQQKSKKERKKAKKAKTLAWGEEYAPISTEEQMQAAESLKPATETEVLPETTGSVDVGIAEDVMLEETARGVEPPHAKDFAPPKSKKDRKKAKKGRASTWDDEDAPLPESEPVNESRDTDQGLREQAPPNHELSEEQKDGAVEDRPKKKGGKKAKKTPLSLWEDDDASAPVEIEDNKKSTDAGNVAFIPEPALESNREIFRGASEHVLDTQNVFDVPNSGDHAQKNRKSVRITAEEPEIIERPPSEAPGYAQGAEERLRDSDSALDMKIDIPDEEAPPTDTPGSAASFDLLDPQEQRQYNEEYQKELERQLSPRQGEVEDSITHNRTPNPATSVPSIRELVDRPREEAEATLPPSSVLEDIIEEPRSGSGSLEGAVADEKDDSFPFKTIKKAKKGKKGKKQQQPIIWEDDTATQGLSHDASGLKASQMYHSPPEFEEPIEQEPAEVEGLQTRDNSEADQSQRPRGEAADYFGTHHSISDEKDVGRSEDDDLNHSLSNERSLMARDGSADSDTRRDRDEVRHEDNVEHSHYEEIGEAGGSYEYAISRSDSIAARQPNKRDWDATPEEKTKNGNKYKAREFESEPNASNSEVQDPQGLVHHRDSSQEDSYDATTIQHLSRQRPLNVHVQRNESPVSEDADVSGLKSRSTEGFAVAAGLGAGVAAATGLTRKDSKKGKKRDKKSNKSGKRTDTVEGEEADREDLSHNDLEQSHSKEESATRAQQQLENTPHRSPERYADFAHTIEEQSDLDPSQRPHSSQHRDSAIHVSDSPVTSDSIPVHQSTRDSGYPDSESAPIVGEPEDQHRKAEREMVGSYGQEAFRKGGSRHEHPESNQRDWSVTPDPFNRPAESGPSYELSRSRSRSKRRRTRRTSGAAYDSDDSADSGFDIQRRRRLQAMAGEQRDPSPVSSTTKDRSSGLFDSSPSARHEDQLRALRALSEDGLAYDEAKATTGGDTQSDASPRNDLPEEDTAHKHTDGPGESRRSLFGGPISEDDHIQSTSRSPARNESRGRQRLDTISEDNLERSPRHRKDKRGSTDVGSPEQGIKTRRTSRRQARSPPPGPDDNAQRSVSTGDPVSRISRPADDTDKHSAQVERSRSRSRDRLSSRQSNASSLLRDVEQRPAGIGSPDSIHAIIRTPDQFRTASGQSFRSATPPSLRRVDRSASGDLRGASKQSQAKSRAKIPEAEPDLGIASSSTYDPLTDKGKNRPDMADVYEGWGDVRGQSPMSPTRPPSMRKRQSMHFADLEQRFEQLASDHRSLQNAKSVADRRLDEQAKDHDQQRRTYEEAMQEHKTYLAEKDLELSKLHEVLEGFKHQVADLTEVNEELSSSRGLGGEHDSRYAGLETEHEKTHQQWQQTTRELGDLREQHTRLANDHVDTVEREVEAARQEKDYELEQLRDELERAKEQVRKLQLQILSSRSNEGYIERDEDYFDGQCQKLCQQVQQWVLRFSKFSDMQACRSTDTLPDTAAERWDDAVLDGSEVDDYLQDRVKRRDVFMSVVMSMMFEFIFTRYLFGMDRLQRKKLKDLQNTLEEIGPMSAVHKWRAITLALLSKRPEFQEQLATDTEGVVHRIFDILADILPPPKHLVDQIQTSLHKVVTMAADLSIEMRTQRAEYSMLPPLKPEFDSAGEVVSKVEFKAITMNERSGTTSSNEALEEQRAAVRMVLFPLVVKRTDDDEQIIVCPAQVLTAAGWKGKKTARGPSTQGSQSVASFAGTEDTRMEGGMF